MLKGFVRKYYLWILFVLSSVLFIGYYQHVFSTSYKPEIRKFKEAFLKQESLLQQFLSQKRTTLLQNNNVYSDSEVPTEDLFFFHLYQKDSLVYWNTNQLPVSKYADIHFPTTGIIHAQNGWYYVSTIQEGKSTLCGSFLIKHDYPYENADLVNSYSSKFNISFSSYISLDQENGFPVYNENKNYLFSIVPNEYQPANHVESINLMIFLLFAVAFLIFGFIQLAIRSGNKWAWILPIVLVVIRFASIQFVWFGFMHDTEGFQASLYGTNQFFPNFFEYLVNVLVILAIIQYLVYKQKVIGPHKYGKAIAIALFVLAFLFWSQLLYLYQGLIENSSISLAIEGLFSLNFYSVLAIISIGVLGYSLFLYVRTVARYAKIQDLAGSTLSVFSFVLGVVYFLWEINFGYQLLFAGIFPIIFYGLILYLEYREIKRKHLVLGICLLAVFSMVTAVNLSEFNRRKDRSERELYANQLVTEKDIVTEVEYAALKPAIQDDRFIQKALSSDKKFDPRDFEDGIEHRHFNGYWERYEISFHLFDYRNRSLLKFQGDQSDLYADMNEIIDKHGKVSEIDSTIFFISDYTGQYSYIIKQPLFGKDSISGTLFCMLKSKKIPEEIGFPRLLISEKASVFDHLNNYSVAKYHKNRLVSKYGRFNYPTSVTALKNANPKGYNNFDFQGHNHFMLYKSGNDVIVLSGKNITWVDILTSFSYLFSFYGILILPIFFRFYSNSFFRQSLTLSAKIQLVLISLVFVSLLGFGWGSGVFVQNQYNEYTNDVIREKLISIETELKSKLGKSRSLSISEDGPYAGLLLQNFAKVFVTDINFYDTHGFLLATSRPKVFNMGLLSEQINSVAKRQLAYLDKSEFIHQEQIGDLDYSSAYMPFYNNEGRLLGFINLQHFGQQEEFEHQIQRFLVAIINVFMLLLAISIVIAIFVSNWVTAPLRILQESFAKVRFGKYNQQISYNKDDEIGALVSDYNTKLEELEFAAQQLAQSERESAWRDMAKQVAHEIKNPLTPMKLSVQQLLRSFDPSDPNAQAKLTKVSNSLVEQIDALTKIANEFSSFAKMPRPNEELVDIVEVISNVIEVFQQSDGVDIQLEGIEHFMIQLDKDQMIRVFNNLIKNAIQAISEETQGLIVVRIRVENEKLQIEIEDNGVGISEEQRSQIFTPYFTTKSTGTGIGLAMVKQIILNHRGTIYFDSTPTVGTTFFIDLPITETQSK